MFMFMFPTVNLPVPILLHALGCCFLGIKLTFTSPTPPIPAIQDRAILGVVTTAIGLAYLSTSYMPLEKNAFLYASAPIRIILAGLAGVKLVIQCYFPRQIGAAGVSAQVSDVTRSRTGILYGILLYDGLGGLLVGWWLGTYSGKIPEYQI
jgi:hypothetical protein